jgi:hypothetical protein
VKVAFRGGSTKLYKHIEDAAMEWTKYGNLKLTFRLGKKFHQWAPSDRKFKGDVRVDFIGGANGGYWSLIGEDSIDTSIVGPGEASMNFEGFPQDLPEDWTATVLHEFGHALGFEHEHQAPHDGCEDDFRWDDDPGYKPTTDQYGQYVIDGQGRRPGIYTQLGGPPNEWDKATVDHNLRDIKDSRAYTQSDFDAHSIMKYFFEDWMFKDGARSPCFSPPAIGLSEVDKQGMAGAYPGRARAQARLSGQDKAFVRTIVEADAPPLELRRRLGRRLSAEP